uniref:Target of Nesh-SH3-like n=1 Tax=Fundulus heteroclitus TaxID=8078 RepID=A0A3Q2TRN5_FUNHE
MLAVGDQLISNQAVSHDHSTSLLSIPEKGNSLRINRTRPADGLTPALLTLLPTSTPRASTTTTTASPVTNSLANGGRTTKAPSRAPEKRPNPAAAVQSQDGSLLLRSALANERAKPRTWGQGSSRNVSPSLALKASSPAASTVSMRHASRTPLYPLSNGFRQLHSSSRSIGSSPTSGILGATGQPQRGLSPPKPALWPRTRLGSPVRPAINIRPNDVRKPGETDKVTRPEKSGNPETLKHKVQVVTTKPTKQERRQTTAAPTAVARQETWEDSDLFKSQPTSDVDAMGKKRYVAPHVVYQTGKKPDEPCSITSSLNYFPEDEPGEVNVTSPPKSPPANLTVVTVEGCPSFIILDWEKPDNHTTEYEVISTAKGPDGERVSILTTNQTHTAVENLNPESSYEFKVKPKNELGEGPLSDPVTFNTESADPRVSENVSGKDAIWTQFPFKTDSYSDCHGKQYVKRTWYRKFVGVQLCNSLRYKIYLSNSLNGQFHHIGDQSGFGEDHCQFVDSFLDGRTGRQLRADQLPSRDGFYRALRQEPVHFGPIGGHSHINYVSWYECGTPIPGKW